MPLKYDKVARWRGRWQHVSAARRMLSLSSSGPSCH
jgi:hypothetical protein